MTGKKGPTMRWIIGVLLLATVLCLPSTACTCTPAYDECDFNQDGEVDAKERRVCEQKEAGKAPQGGLGNGVALSPPGGVLITYVKSEGIGNIAVRIESPEKPRYPEGAPIVVNVRGWFAQVAGFSLKFDLASIGAVSMTYLWPGTHDPKTGAKSDGVNDYCGPDALAALRDVIRFACGLTPNVDGYYIDELLETEPLTDNVGIFASSHAGVPATNVLAYRGKEMPTVRYLVGRENPTMDEMYPLELGHFDDHGQPVFNPYYHPEHYTPTTIDIDYSTVGWIVNNQYPEGMPYFAVPNGTDYVLSGKGPEMWGKRYFSAALTKALRDNGAFAPGSWPEGLATPEETAAVWPYRTTVNNYPLFRAAAPNLKVMLVFAKNDHVQAAPDKPHIRQAYDGFRRAAGLWVRLNPDIVYVKAMEGNFGEGFPDNPANAEPNDWMDSRNWGFPHRPQILVGSVPVVGVAEMADRVQADDWSANLDEVLFNVTQYNESREIFFEPGIWMTNRKLGIAYKE